MPRVLSDSLLLGARKLPLRFERRKAVGSSLRGLSPPFHGAIHSVKTSWLEIDSRANPSQRIVRHLPSREKLVYHCPDSGSS